MQTLKLTRSMATLKDIKQRMKIVGNIQKITKSMKMVSAAKYNKCERELRSVKGLRVGSSEFSRNLTSDTSNKAEEAKGKHVVIGVSSDRGLCGGIHSSIIRYIKNMYKNTQSPAESMALVLIGDKLRSGLQTTCGDSFALTVSEVSKSAITFDDAMFISNKVFSLPYEIDKFTIIYNRFVSAIQFETTTVDSFAPSKLANSTDNKIYDFDELDPDTVYSAAQFQLACTIYQVMKEAAASEQSARMAAMDNASKNASEMINKLSLLFNRTRQSMITRELSEIISGASAISDEAGR